ncbi:MAG: flagellar protein FliS, partial [Phycisphaerales bacterium]|nr:flagellar protein FliS [Phycisphaerales bacterium]
MNQSAATQYLKNAVMTASHEQLQLMLIDGAIRFALKGREAIEGRDIEGMFNALDRS